MRLKTPSRLIQVGFLIKPVPQNVLPLWRQWGLKLIQHSVNMDSNNDVASGGLAF